MKNIQVIDGAENCVYDLFAATDEEFARIFPNGTDIAFIEVVLARDDSEEILRMFTNLWTRPVKKAEAQGIHGILFYELDEKKQYYPNRRDEDAVNPSGSRLR